MDAIRSAVLRVHETDLRVFSLPDLVTCRMVNHQFKFYADESEVNEMIMNQSKSWGSFTNDPNFVIKSRNQRTLDKSGS